MDSVLTDFKIIRTASGVKYFCDRHIRFCGGVELQNTGNIPHDLRTKIQSSSLTEDTASCRIQILAFPEQNTRHTSFFKQENDLSIILVGFQLSQCIQITLHRDRNPLNRNPDLFCQLPDLFQDILFRASAAQTDSFLSVCFDHRIILYPVTAIFRHDILRKPGKLSSLGIRDLRYSGR